MVVVAAAAAAVGSGAGSAGATEVGSVEAIEVGSGAAVGAASEEALAVAASGIATTLEAVVEALEVAEDTGAVVEASASKAAVVSAAATMDQTGTAVHPMDPADLAALVEALAGLPTAGQVGLVRPEEDSAVEVDLGGVGTAATSSAKADREDTTIATQNVHGTRPACHTRSIAAG